MSDGLSQGLAAFAVLIAAVVGWLEVEGDVRAGITRMAGATAVRQNEPVLFWLYVSIRGEAVVACVWLLGYAGFQMLRSG